MKTLEEYNEFLISNNHIEKDQKLTEANEIKYRNCEGCFFSDNEEDDCNRGSAFNLKNNELDDISKICSENSTIFKLTKIGIKKK